MRLIFNLINRAGEQDQVIIKLLCWCNLDPADFWTPLCVKYIYKALTYLKLPQQAVFNPLHIEEGNNGILLE